MLCFAVVCLFVCQEMENKKALWRGAENINEAMTWVKGKRYVSFNESYFLVFEKSSVETVMCCHEINYCELYTLPVAALL